MSRFKVGDEVTRPKDCFKPVKKWQLKHGVVTRVYSKWSTALPDMPSYYLPELYEVVWNDGKVGKGYLPHGIELEIGK